MKIATSKNWIMVIISPWSLTIGKGRILTSFRGAERVNDFLIFKCQYSNNEFHDRKKIVVFGIVMIELFKIKRTSLNDDGDLILTFKSGNLN